MVISSIISYTQLILIIGLALFRNCSTLLYSSVIIGIFHYMLNLVSLIDMLSAVGF